MIMQIPWLLMASLSGIRMKCFLRKDMQEKQFGMQMRFCNGWIVYYANLAVVQEMTE